MPSLLRSINDHLSILDHMKQFIVLFLVQAPDESEPRDLSNGQVPNVKLYVVVACIAALVLVAIIQASCTIFKMSRRGSSVQKVGYPVFVTVKAPVRVSQHPTPTNMNPFMSIVRAE